jgi:hypothetical protein
MELRFAIFSHFLHFDIRTSAFALSEPLTHSLSPAVATAGAESTESLKKFFKNFCSDSDFDNFREILRKCSIIDNQKVKRTTATQDRRIIWSALLT